MTPRADAINFSIEGASILDHAADILEQRGFCSSPSGAINIADQPCDPNDDEAVAWTSSGAIYRAWRELRKVFPKKGSFGQALDIVNKRTWEEHNIDRFGVLSKELRDAGMAGRVIEYMRRWAEEVFRAHNFGG